MERDSFLSPRPINFKQKSAYNQFRDIHIFDNNDELKIKTSNIEPTTGTNLIRR